MSSSTSMRTHQCGQLRPEHIGTTVSLCGWVATRREHGDKLAFVDLRDHTGVTQCVVDNQVDVRGEYVVRVTGVVAARPPENLNDRLPTGGIELQDCVVEVLNAAEPPPFPPLPANVEEAFTDAVANNPSILAAREDLRAASAGVDEARAAGRAQISLVGTAGVQETYGDTGQRDTSVSAVAQGRIPLFSGGAVKAQVNSAKLQREQARRRIDAFETQVRAQVAQSWYGYDAATRAIEASRRQVEAAEIAYEGAKQELAVGVRTTLDVLDQEQQLFEARLALVGAERDAYVAAHQLLRATGGLDTIG